jgi:hypothetical protein
MLLNWNDKATNTLVGQMDHSEAVNQMAAEKYLLGELPPDVRDAFEEHFFDCPECAFDIRTGMAFLGEAKVQLPGLAAAPAVASAPAVSPVVDEPIKSEPGKARTAESGSSKDRLRGWWRGLFATLLLVIGYQNLVTYPALRSEATEPRMLPAVSLHGGTRAGGSTVIEADRKLGVSVLVDLPEAQGYSSFAVDLYDVQGKLAWTHNFSASEIGTDGGTLSLIIPGGGLRQGIYAFVVSGVTSQGQRSELERHSFDVHIHD